MPANDRQHGGAHYKGKAIEPWDYVAANGIGFFEGNAIKYLTRWRDRGGITDLKKAQHYVEKLIELETSTTPPGQPAKPQGEIAMAAAQKKATKRRTKPQQAQATGTRKQMGAGKTTCTRKTARAK
jgi:hypothetical protein